MEDSPKVWHKSHSFRQSFRYAWRGVKDVYGREGNMRRQLWLFAAALLVAILLRLPASQLAIVLLTSGVILALEFVNTALESIEDIIWPEYREAVKRSKDAAAAAVLIMSFAAVLIGCLLFLPPLARLFA